MHKTLLTTVLLATATAQAAEPFVGKYEHGGADWGMQLWLLDHHKFCYAMSAGSMDIITGGSWQKTAQNGDIITIELTEQKLPISDVVIVANPKVGQSTLTDAQKQTGSQRILFLTPPALENALGSMNPLIGFSETEKLSDKLKLAYSTKGGTPMYAHIGIPEKARYVFVGSTQNNKLYRFNIGNSQYAKLNPNPQAGRPSIDTSLTYHVKTQILNDISLRQALTQQAQQAAWKACEPKTNGVATSVKGNQRTLLNAETITPLKPYYQANEALETWSQD